LLLARMMGWERISFIDDDIRDVAPHDLSATIAMLGRYRSAGMRVTNYPDNSVVCHANRQTGGDQDVFVSGSVLAVNTMKPFSFFPEIYNEDWLFFYDDACSRQLGSWEGHARQLPYDPFEQPLRAERQEFGDALAEGLYALLDEGRNVTWATEDYWNQFLAARSAFLANILERSHYATPQVQGKMVSAVMTAMMCLMQTKPAMYAEYVRAWRKDISVWTENVGRLPRLSSVESALGGLGLKISGSTAVEQSRPSAGVAAGGMPPIVAAAGTPDPAPEVAIPTA
jgi:hypothetical protein